MSLDQAVLAFGGFVSFLVAGGVFLAFYAPAYREEARREETRREETRRGRIPAEEDAR